MYYRSSYYNRWLIMFIKKKNIFLNNCWFTLPVFKNKNLLPFYSKKTKKNKKNAQPRFEPRPSTLHKLTTPRRAHLTTALSLHVLPEVLFGIYIVASSKNKLKVIFLKLQKKTTKNRSHNNNIKRNYDFNQM